MSFATTIFTIGHSTHDIDEFLKLLQKHKISVVADVRSIPYSEYCPQFNKEKLKQTLQKVGLHYRYSGDILGGHQEFPDSFSFDLNQLSTEYMKEVESLTNDSQNQNIAIMCKEKEPHICHRTLRIARVLELKQVCVQHILANGKLENQIEAMKNLRKAYNQDSLDLFETSEDERTRLVIFAQEQKNAENRSKSMASTVKLEVS